VNDRVYETLNNGVYRAGFTSSQEAYHEAVQPLFETLEWLELRLNKNRYLLGSNLTEADVRLFTTLIRFDSVYYGHFKCNLKRIVDLPSVWRFTRELYAMPEIRETVNFDHIKNHYYQSHRQINPSGIVPDGPQMNFNLLEKKFIR
jgi:glutathionyl-hydroquinone reductase